LQSNIQPCCAAVCHCRTAAAAQEAQAAEARRVRSAEAEAKVLRAQLTDAVAAAEAAAGAAAEVAAARHSSEVQRRAAARATEQAAADAAQCESLRSEILLLQRELAAAVARADAAEAELQGIGADVAGWAELQGKGRRICGRGKNSNCSSSHGSAQRAGDCGHVLRLAGQGAGAADDGRMAEQQRELESLRLVAAEARAHASQQARGRAAACSNLLATQHAHAQEIGALQARLLAAETAAAVAEAGQERLLAVEEAVAAATEAAEGCGGPILHNRALAADERRCHSRSGSDAGSDADGSFSNDICSIKHSNDTRRVRRGRSRYARQGGGVKSSWPALTRRTGHHRPALQCSGSGSESCWDEDDNTWSSSCDFEGALAHAEAALRVSLASTGRHIKRM
jgi:hypothetical protein